MSAIGLILKVPRWSVILHKKTIWKPYTPMTNFVGRVIEYTKVSRWYLLDLFDKRGSIEDIIDDVWDGKQVKLPRAAYMILVFLTQPVGLTWVSSPCLFADFNVRIESTLCLGNLVQSSRLVAPGGIMPLIGTSYCVVCSIATSSRLKSIQLFSAHWCLLGFSYISNGAL